MKLLIDGTTGGDTQETITDFREMKSGTLNVYPPFVVYDYDTQTNAAGPFSHLWQALAARAELEFSPRAEK